LCYSFYILEESVRDANKAIEADKIMNVDSLYEQSLIDFFEKMISRE